MNWLLVLSWTAVLSGVALWLYLAAASMVGAWLKQRGAADEEAGAAEGRWPQ